jgi:hypothetical protein
MTLLYWSGPDPSLPSDVLLPADDQVLYAMTVHQNDNPALGAVYVFRPVIVSQEQD